MAYIRNLFAQGKKGEIMKECLHSSNIAGIQKFLCSKGEKKNKHWSVVDEVAPIKACWDEKNSISDGNIRNVTKQIKPKLIMKFFELVHVWILSI